MMTKMNILNLNFIVMKKIIIISITIVSFSTRAQLLTIDAQIDGDGIASYFCFGDLEKSDEVKDIDLRANEINSASINNFMEENRYFRFNYAINSTSQNYFEQKVEWIKFEKGSNDSIIGGVSFNAEFESQKTKTKNVFAIGQLSGDFEHFKKIEFLEFATDAGRELDYSKFKSLKGIRTQDHFDGFLGYRQKNLHDPLMFNYPGDPFFWSDLSKAEKLESIRFSSMVQHFRVDFKGNLYFLDGFNSDILKLENLNSLSLNGLPYFTVNFFSLEKLVFLELQDIQGPELLNLALVMGHFNENIELRNCIGYLSIIDTSQTINLSENGHFRTEYENGQTLCEGSFKNGVPHGDWKFWYADGIICQERSYDNGQPVGKWTLRAPKDNEYLPDGNILAEFTYLNGKLVNRKDFRDGHYLTNQNCIQGEDDPLTLTTSEYKLFWGEGNNVEIEKKIVSVIAEKNRYRTMGEQLGDTLIQIVENWSFGAENWSHKYKYQCTGKISLYEVERRGNAGQGAYYQKITEDGWNSSNRTSIINLKDRTWEESVYEKNSSDSLELIYHVRDTISQQEWSVDMK
jgi:antitoxin component YwqK of YwqJK toxin-antitoxin module